MNDGDCTGSCKPDMGPKTESGAWPGIEAKFTYCWVRLPDNHPLRQTVIVSRAHYRSLRSKSEFARIDGCSLVRSDFGASTSELMATSARQCARNLDEGRTDLTAFVEHGAVSYAGP